MPRRLSEIELGQAYGGETAHGEHVARLALRLFGRLRATLSLPRDEAVLLQAVCRLHDIGFASAPRDHARRGAWILLHRWGPSVPARRRRIAAAAVLLHPGPACRVPRTLSAAGVDAFLAGSGLVPRRGRGASACAAGDARAALRLAAFLRVADGLDHTHAQTASIADLRVGRGAITARVRDGVSGACARAAAAKADLWPRVFGRRLRIAWKPPAVPSAARFGRLLRRGDGALECARKLTGVLHRQAADNLSGSLRGGDEKPLHDLRVAVRRLRGVLRFFRPILGGRRERRMDAAIRRLCRRLGPPRDAQVRLALLGEVGRRRRLGRRPAWRGFLRSQAQRNAASLAGLTRILRGGRFRRLLDESAYVARAVLPRRILAGAGPEMRGFAARRLSRLCRRAFKAGGRIEALSPEALHELRKMCRRARYGAEFSAPVLGPAVLELERRLKAVTDALGRVHDLDVLLAEARRLRGAAGALPRDVLEAERRRALPAGRRALKRLQKKRFRRELSACLGSAKASGKKGAA